MMHLTYDNTIAGRCPVCASHGVVSRIVCVPVAGYTDGRYIKETRDVPCPHCTSGSGSHVYHGA